MMQDTGRETPRLVSATRLLRRLSPPLASVLFRIEWADDRHGAENLIVHLDGQELSQDLYELTQIDERLLLLIIRGEAFPWVSSQQSRSRIELFLRGQGLLTENIEVEGFQAA